MVSIYEHLTVFVHRKKCVLILEEASLQWSDVLVVNHVFKARKGFAGSFKSQVTSL